MKIRASIFAALVVFMFGAILPAHAQGPSQCKASASAPSYGEGNNASQSCDLNGNLRTVQDSGNAAIIYCNQKALYDNSTNGTTQLVPGSGTLTIYLCGYSILAAGTVNVELDDGTGTKITPAFQLTAQAGIVDGSDFFRGLKSNAGGALSIKTSAGVAVQAIVYYAQQ